MCIYKAGKLETLTESITYFYALEKVLFCLEQVLQCCNKLFEVLF